MQSVQFTSDSKIHIFDSLVELSDHLGPVFTAGPKAPEFQGDAGSAVSGVTVKGVICLLIAPNAGPYVLLTNVAW